MSGLAERVARALFASVSEREAAWDYLTPDIQAYWIAYARAALGAVADDVDGLAGVLRAEGLADGGDPHGWRCSYPDRYPGICTCVDDIAKALAAYIRGGA